MLLKFIKRYQSELIRLLLVTLLFFPVILATKFHGSDLLLIALLWLIWMCSRPIYLFLASFVSLSSIIYIHILQHWGKKAFDARIEVALVSPAYEMKEYLQTYLNGLDVFIIVYFVVLIAIMIFYKKGALREIPKPICFIALVLFVVSSKNIPPMKFYKELYRAVERNKMLQQRMENISKLPLKTIEDGGLYDTVVIVMGESASRHHMAVYGYPRQTTPFLSNNPYSFCFTAIAPSNQTRLSVPLILSDVDVHHWNDFYTSPSIVSLLKNSHFNTTWISNQRSRGRNDTSSASISLEAENRAFLNLNAKNFSEKDIVIPRYISQMLQRDQNQSKEAWFIHLMGSHQGYRSRYERSMVPFSDKSVQDQYDNSIFYTDYVLGKIYTLFKDRKLLMIYLSDHAEVLTQSSGGHGYDPPYKDEYDVPFVVISNVTNPYLSQIHSENDTTQFNLDDFPCILRNILRGEEICIPRNDGEVIAVTPTHLYRYETLKYSENCRKILDRQVKKVKVHP